MDGVKVKIVCFVLTFLLANFGHGGQVLSGMGLIHLRLITLKGRKDKKETEKGLVLFWLLLNKAWDFLGGFWCLIRY